MVCGDLGKFKAPEKLTRSATGNFHQRLEKGLLG